MSLLEVKDLWWKYSDDTDWVLKGLNFKIEPEEVVCVVGPTGAGKTTTLSLIQGILHKSYLLGELKGDVIFNGISIRSDKYTSLTGKIGMVFESAESQFLFPSVIDDLTFSLEMLGIASDEVEKRVASVVEEFDLKRLINRAPNELSGGEKQRIIIAELLAVRPDILLLDEPTSELDPVGKEEVMDMIRRMKERFNMSIIIVEQDLEEISPLADRFLLISDGKVVKEGKTKDFLSDPSELMNYGVYPTDLSIVFDRIRKSGHKVELTLDLNQAVEKIRELMR